ncbi:L-histidine N(alpha)-methyltransferase [soil metagenome]
MIHVPVPEDGETLAQSVRRGLLHQPKFLLCQFLYDSEGSEIFEQICDLPEYYLTRTEDAILSEQAEAMVTGWSHAPVMIELGSGSSTKTRRLIEAALKTYGRLHYVPIDVSPTILEQSAQDLVDEYSELQVTGYAADYRTALDELKQQIKGPKLIVFLGSSLGNFDRDDATALLQQIAETMQPKDRFLLGTDLVKAPEILEAAYDDDQDVTRRFNTNILARLNRELGADFDLDRFEYRARFNPTLQRVEMFQVSLVDQVVTIPGARLKVHLANGETIHTENSHKYTPDSLQELAANAGFVEEHDWTDDGGLFRVQRWRLREDSSSV